MNLYDLPEVLEAGTNLIRALVWPALTGAIVFYFRKEIRELLKKLQELKAIGGPGLWNFLFDSSEDGQPSPQPQVALASPSNAAQGSIPFDKDKYGNIFWVGHDLLWTVAQLLSKGPREKILEGLFQSKHHLNEVRFVESSFSSRLERIYHETLRTVESDWTAERRGKVATEVQSIARELGGVISANQPAFKSHPSS
jgi:hypothetical protein